MNKVIKVALTMAATVSQKAADRAAGDWNWAWSYKPERPNYDESATECEKDGKDI